MYETIVGFNDLQDNNFRYNVGDIYPREGLKPSKKRVKELSTKLNRRKKVLISLVEDKISDDEPEKVNSPEASEAVDKNEVLDDEPETK